MRKYPPITRRDTHALPWVNGGTVQLTGQVAVNRFEENPALPILHLELTDLETGRSVRVPVTEDAIHKLGQWLQQVAGGANHAQK